MASSYETTKNCPALAIEGHSYRFDKLITKDTKKRWRWRTRDCNGSLYTNNNEENTNIDLRTPHREHCIPDPEMRSIEKVITELKIKVRSQATPIPSLFDESAAMLSQSPITASRFPLFNQIDTSLYRERLRHLPALPKLRSELDLPDHLKQTMTGNNFHIYSSVNNDLIVFGIECNIRKLSTNSHWCVDGTFKSVPKLFVQLFSIHVFEGDKLIPLIYCLLSSKTQSMYSELFRALKDKANTLDIILMPSLFTCDFERGLISSIRLEFPTASIRGCYFHFCQAVYRRVQTLGLSTLYIHDQESRLYIRKLLAIAFVPIDLIPQTFQNLKYMCQPELQSLFTYFENFWIDTVNHNLWNMYGIQRRTNNNLEGWHLRLNRAIGKTHANIYEFILKIIKEQGVTETLLAQIEAGNIKLHSNNIKYKQINERIGIITRDFNNGIRNIDEFLTGIAHNLAQPTNISL